MQHTALEPYRVANSLIHRLDARLKLLATLAFVLAATTLPPSAWGALALLSLVAVLLIVVSHTPPMMMLRRSLVALPFVGMIALTLPFTRDGQLLWGVQLGRRVLGITDLGLLSFVSMLVKGWLSVLVASLLVTTTPFPTLLQAMQALRVPKILILIISFMYRYLFVLVDEALCLQRARLARSAARSTGGSGGTLLWRIKVLGGMIGSLFIRSYARSERIYQAMLSRGYDGQWFAVAHFRWQPRDTWAGLLMGIGLVAVMVFGVCVR